jgi:choline-sulfatase
VDALVYQHSAFATTCALAGIAPPKSIEFPSLANLLQGGGSQLHDAVFCWYRNYQRSVRTQEHKLIVYPQAGTTQLFDLREDPWETADVSGRPEYAAARGHLLERLRRFQRELGDDFCQPV